MRNGHNQHQNIYIQHKATFLPMLCSRPSIKDVALPRLQDPSFSFSTDPLSPKIGCMGQIKRHNNRVAGFPTSNKIINITTPVSLNYSKLKRIFSSKTNNNNNNNISKRGGGAKNMDDSKENFVSINVEEMDPPLPVIKKVHKAADGGEVDTLWKRRSSGLALQNLHLQQIQLNRHHFAHTTSI